MQPKIEAEVTAGKDRQPINMKPIDLEAERKYRLLERLGLMCGDGLPTPAQLEIAHQDANEAIERLKHLVTAPPKG